jgi:hypothetical protein
MRTFPDTNLFYIVQLYISTTYMLSGNIIPIFKNKEKSSDP